MLLADGLEDAFIGIGQQFNSQFAIYDREKCIQIFIDKHDMDREMAEEYFENNVQGASVGESTPIFVDRCSIDDIETESVQLVEWVGLKRFIPFN